MTTMLDAFKNVEAEIIDRIQKITPNGQKRFKFIYYGDDKQSRRPIEEFTGHPRVFRLGNQETLVPNVATCFESNRKINIVPLSILYPMDNFEGANWNALAADDLNLIRADLLNNSTSVAGVGYRIIRKDATPQYLKYTDDPWHLITVGIEIYFDVTTS